MHTQKKKELSDIFFFKFIIKQKIESEFDNNWLTFRL